MTADSNHHHIMNDTKNLIRGFAAGSTDREKTAGDGGDEAASEQLRRSRGGEKACERQRCSGAAV